MTDTNDPLSEKHILEKKSWLEKITFALLGEPKTRDQLIELLRDAKDRALLDTDALNMIEGVLQVSEMKVRDIMIPRSQMVVIEKQLGPRELAEKLIESGHSRFPVVDPSSDHVLGILLAKDLLRYAFQLDEQVFKLSELLRPVIFVPESKRLNILLKEFRTSRNHMAIVVDEYDQLAGLVTIEDVLELIVGEIADEFDDSEEQEQYIVPQPNGSFVIKALTPVEEFNEYFATSLDQSNFDTIGGLIAQNFGHVPKRGEILQLGDLKFKVLAADKRRIRLLHFSRVVKT